MNILVILKGKDLIWYRLFIIFICYLVMSNGFLILVDCDWLNFKFKNIKKAPIIYCDTNWVR